MAALRRCDAVFWLADWQQSKGARAEHIDAEARGKVMLYTLAQVQTYITVCRGVAR
jgi:hypothetical protein